ncbi:MAG: hypothetical protein H7Y17_16355 [Chlorobia bacterium]|nr:hypothetical protein [Fimbriimonadaceae bacterium]
MRRRWVWIGVAATALILAAFALIPREPDELDFIRRHNPQHEVYRVNPPVWHKVFVFKQIPAGLLIELRKLSNLEPPSVYFSFDLPSGREALCNVSLGQIFVSNVPEPSWLTVQWQLLMERISPPFTN